MMRTVAAALIALASAAGAPAGDPIERQARAIGVFMAAWEEGDAVFAMSN